MFIGKSSRISNLKIDIDIQNLIPILDEVLFLSLLSPHVTTKEKKKKNFLRFR